MLRSLWTRVTSVVDIEMFQKGWWMLLLIMGTIAVLFAVCCILVLGQRPT